MTEHQVAVLPAVEPDAWARLARHRIVKFRAECSCGWVGMTAGQEWATAQARRHLQAVATTPVDQEPGDRQ